MTHFQAYKWPWQNKPRETKTTTQRPVDCLWSSWSTHIPCSKTCGQGTEWVHRRIVREAKNGGRECMGTDETIRPRQCSIKSCPGLSNMHTSPLEYYFNECRILFKPLRFWLTANMAHGQTMARAAIRAARGRRGFRGQY